MKPSIPILFFGDYERYLRSPLKIITVGLNPSKDEFPQGKAFKRFSAVIEQYEGMLRGEMAHSYMRALSDYFRNDPYGWFKSFEPVLQGLGASYYGFPQNAVLHTDICSPLATSPPWTGLTPQQREQLRTDGIGLCRALVRHLKPHVLILSVAWEHTRKIRFEPVTDWQTIHEIYRKKDGSPRKTPYQVRAHHVRLTDDACTYVVFGQAANTPFGTASTADKHRIGVRVKEALNGA